MAPAGRTAAWWPAVRRYPQARMLDRAVTAVNRFWKLAAAGCLALAVLIAAVALIAQPSERDGDQVRNVLRDFVTAAGDRDGDAACRLLSEAGRRAVTAVVPGTTCESYARSFGFDVAGLGSVQVNLPEDLPDHVVIDGTNTIGPDGQPVQRRVALSRTSDGYRIDALAR
jgi:hypothetical protein